MYFCECALYPDFIKGGIKPEDTERDHGVNHRESPHDTEIGVFNAIRDHASKD